MSIQPSISLFNFEKYEKEIIPEIIDLFLGHPSDFLREKYHSEKFDFDHLSRVCPKDCFSQCLCFDPENLILNHKNSQKLWCWQEESVWHDSREVWLINEILARECTDKPVALSKALSGLNRFFKEEFQALGLGLDLGIGADDQRFYFLLDQLCHRWQGTWLDVDSIGVAGYLVLDEVIELKKYLEPLICETNNTSWVFDQYQGKAQGFMEMLEPIRLQVNQAIECEQGVLWRRE